MGRHLGVYWDKFFPNPKAAAWDSKAQNSELESLPWLALTFSGVALHVSADENSQLEKFAGALVAAFGACKYLSCSKTSATLRSQAAQERGIGLRADLN